MLGAAVVMRSWALTLVAFTLPACMEAEDPFARKLTESDRESWGKICGSEYVAVGSPPTDYVFSSAAGEEPIVECKLVWDRRHGYFSELVLRVGYYRPVGDDQLEPYRQLIERELPEETRQLVREIGDGPTRSVDTRVLNITGGWHEHSWHMYVGVRR